MVVTGLDVNGALDQHSAFWAQLQATLNFLPAHAWYALPNGALTFLNARIADYLVSQKIILSGSVQTPEQIGTPTLLFCILMIAKKHAESGRNVYAQVAPVR